MIDAVQTGGVAARSAGGMVSMQIRKTSRAIKKTSGSSLMITTARLHGRFLFVSLIVCDRTTVVVIGRAVRCRHRCLSGSIIWGYGSA